MSDPVTNIEIEDVLSSIRRLVSDEARAHEREEKDPSFSSDVPPQAVELEEESQELRFNGAEQSVQRSTPALVLTPALRIEPESGKDADEQRAEDTQEADSQEQNEPALILTQDDAADENNENSPEMEVSEQQNEDSEDQSVPEAAVEAHAPSEDYAEPEEAAVYEMDDAPEAEADFSTHLEPIEYNLHAVEDVDDTEFDNGNDEEQDDEPRTIEDKIAALEALISRSDSDFEPDGAEDGGNAARSGQSLPWEESREPRGSLQESTMPDPEEASQTAVFSDGAAAFQRAHFEAVGEAQAELEANAAETLLESEDMGSVLDEEALRDMVAEIVRQELQGPLGERITRNVRKLVRREIYRAMAANELD